MKKYLIYLFLVFSFIMINNVNANYYDDNFTFCSTLDGASLIGNDGEFLGILSSNEFDTKSISNSFGTYGSEFNTKSIWNEFGTYGNEFNVKSPWNEFSNKSPYILKGAKSYGRLTINEFSNSNYNTFDVLRCFVSLSDSRYKPYMDKFKSSSSSSSISIYTPIKSINKKTCGLNSFLKSNGNCSCYSGYVWKDKNNTKNFDCIKKIVQVCGTNSYLNISGKCSCNPGYIWKYPNNSKNFDCKKKKTISELCGEEYGIYSIPSNLNTNSCICKEGYEWNSNKTNCVKSKVKTCGLNSYLNASGKCTCNTGYIWKFPDNAKNFDCIKKKTKTQLCQEKYGVNSFDINNKCVCDLGYVWNSNKTSCIKNFVEKKVKTENKVNEKLINKANLILKKINNNTKKYSSSKRKSIYKKYIKLLKKYSENKAKGDLKIIVDLIVEGLQKELDNNVGQTTIEIWQASYYKGGLENSNIINGPVFTSYIGCKNWAIDKKPLAYNNYVFCSKNCHNSVNGTPICEDVVRSWKPLSISKTFDDYLK